MTQWKGISKMRIMSVAFFALVLLGSAQGQVSGDYHRSGPHLSGGVSIGYDIGMPVQGHLLVQDLAEGLPLSFRFLISHSFFLEPGDPKEARRVFINQNTNGVPSKSASRWVFGLDLLQPVNFLSVKRAYLYGGIHYSRFTSTFDFIGGNEFFDVNANQIGVGAGWESYFSMAPRVDLVFSLGGEYYFPATLEGHDAAYSPDGKTVNQRENFTYSDADHAINQPTFQPKVLVGINYSF